MRGAQEGKSLSGRASIWSKLSAGEKIGRIARICLIGLACLIGSVVTLGSFIYRLVREGGRDEYKMKVVERQREHLVESLNLKVNGAQTAGKLSFMEVYSEVKDALGENQEYKAGYFAAKWTAFRDELSGFEKATSTKDIERLYGKFQALAEDPIFVEGYNALKRRSSGAAEFLNVVYTRFRSADVSDILEEYAEKTLGSLDSQEQVAKKLKDHQDGWFNGFSREGGWGILWALSHPDQWLHSWDSNSCPEAYDSQIGNPTYAVSNGKQNGVSVVVLSGPTPFHDPALLFKDDHEMRLNNLDASKGHERPWIKKVQDRTNDKSSQIAAGFKTKMKADFFKQAKTVQDLVEGYIASVSDTTDFQKDVSTYVPKKLATPEQMESIGQKVIEYFPKGKNLQNETQKLAVLAFVDASLLYAANQVRTMNMNVKDVLYVPTACKQDYDRGPTTKVIYEEMLDGNGQTQPDPSHLKRWAGLPLFRSLLNADRKQLSRQSAVYRCVVRSLDGERLGALTRGIQQIFPRRPNEGSAVVL